MDIFQWLLDEVVMDWWGVEGVMVLICVWSVLLATGLVSHIGDGYGDILLDVDAVDDSLDQLCME